MPNRKGVFVGAYLDPVIKRDIKRAAQEGHRTMSQEVSLRLTVSLYGSSEIPGRKAGGRLLPALLRSSEIRLPHVPAAGPAGTACDERYTRHRFHERRGGPALSHCTRCGAPNPDERATACSEGFTRHRFYERRGGPVLGRCARCGTPNPDERALRQPAPLTTEV